MAEPLFDPVTGKARDLERLRSHIGRPLSSGHEVIHTESARITRDWTPGRDGGGKVTVDVARYDAPTDSHVRPWEA